MRHITLLALAIVVCSASLILPSAYSSEPGGTPGKGPRPGLQPLDEAGRMRIGEGDRCPVCAMRPIKKPKFSSAIQLKDGRTFYFCGPVCMIRTWMHPETFLAVEKGDLAVPVTRDYVSDQEMDARKVKWVFGSDILPPMGAGPIPIYGESEIESFLKRHGGRFVYSLEEIDDEKWEQTTGRKP